MNHSVYPYPRLSVNLPGLMLAASLTMASISVHADHWISAGKAPSSEGGGFSLAAMTQSSANFAWGLGIVFNSDIAGNNVLDYPVPHDNYSSQGNQRTGNAIGLDALWFPAGDSTWKPYVGIGLYYDKRAEVARSNATGWYYANEETSEVRGGVEAGIQYRSSNDMLFGVGYHSVRGAFISLGW